MAFSPQALGQMLMEIMQVLNQLQSHWAGLMNAPPQIPNAFAQAEASAGGAQAQAFAGSGNAASAAISIAIAIAINSQTEDRQSDSASAALAASVPAETPQPDASLAVAAASGGDGGDGGGGDGGDPIILDLNGDNQLDVTGKDGKKIDFNLFGNGTPVKTEWLKAGAQDGLLVSDFNGDGQIDSGRELMRTTGVNGEQGQYKGGWDKLSQLFDQNHDGKVAGSEIEKLQVWVDKDGDGKSEDGELHSLTELGITQIDVPTEGVRSTFLKDGKKQLAEDYVFDLET
ncbi:MAG: hypothetical protein KF760_07825 [Candidatus Eremiobacteraeota bacterium]|nr:hypothetical protein [Candidatus Eremiobacteraeota bacterium]MCW5869595.1 hypothetical protein [Candidatus Eremiobacteraeota bacterium]